MLRGHDIEGEPCMVVACSRRGDPLPGLLNRRLPREPGGKLAADLLFKELGRLLAGPVTVTGQQRHPVGGGRLNHRVQRPDNPRVHLIAIGSHRQLNGKIIGEQVIGIDKHQAPILLNRLQWGGGFLRRQRNRLCRNGGGGFGSRLRGSGRAKAALPAAAENEPQNEACQNNSFHSIDSFVRERRAPDPARGQR